MRNWNNFDKRLLPTMIVVGLINLCLLFGFGGIGLVIGIIISVIAIPLAESRLAEQDDAVRQAKKDQLLDLMLTKELKRKGVK